MFGYTTLDIHGLHSEDYKITQKVGENMKVRVEKHVLTLKLRERIRRETVKFGYDTIIGRYAYRYNPQTRAILRAPFDELMPWEVIDYIE